MVSIGAVPFYLPAKPLSLAHQFVTLAISYAVGHKYLQIIQLYESGDQ